MAQDDDLIRHAADLLKLKNPRQRKAYEWGLAEIVRRTQDALEQKHSAPRQHDLSKKLRELKHHIRRALSLAQDPGVKKAMAYGAGDLPVNELNKIAGGIGHVIDRLQLAGRHGAVSAMRVVQLPAKTYMTVLTIRLLQKASGNRPGRGNDALMQLLGILWASAGGDPDEEWDRAIREVRGIRTLDRAPAYISARLEADELVQDICHRERGDNYPA